MQKSSVEPEIFPIFQHKVERIPHFARVTEVRYIFLILGPTLLFQKEGLLTQTI